MMLNLEFGNSMHLQKVQTLIRLHLLLQSDQANYNKTCMPDRLTFSKYLYQKQMEWNKYLMEESTSEMQQDKGYSKKLV